MRYPIEKGCCTQKQCGSPFGCFCKSDKLFFFVHQTFCVIFRDLIFLHDLLQDLFFRNSVISHRVDCTKNDSFIDFIQETAPLQGRFCFKRAQAIILDDQYNVRSLPQKHFLRWQQSNRQTKKYFLSKNASLKTIHTVSKYRKYCMISERLQFL